MNKKDLPKIGERWCLKNSHKEIVTITHCHFDKITLGGGHVLMTMPWSMYEETCKCLDTFLHQYIKCSDNAD